ncbi:hypothetical protein LguiA_002052 [Lonicera macranthoides]
MARKSPRLFHLSVPPSILDSCFTSKLQFVDGERQKYFKIYIHIVTMTESKI